MDAALNRTSLLWGVPGLVLQILGNLLAGLGKASLDTPLAFLSVVAGTGLLLVGLAYYARAKGHSPWWGLVGLLSCIGVVALALLPDRLPVVDADAIVAADGAAEGLLGEERRVGPAGDDPPAQGVPEPGGNHDRVDDQETEPRLHEVSREGRRSLRGPG